MRRSRVESAITIVLRGNPEETENQIQKLFQNITGDIESPAEVPTEVIQDTPKPQTNQFIDPFEPLTPLN